MKTAIWLIVIFLFQHVCNLLGDGISSEVSLPSHYAGSPASRFANADDLPAYLVAQLDQLDFSELEPAARIATYLSISRELFRSGREELSHSVQADAFDVAKRDEPGTHFNAIFSHALETHQFDLAESIVSQKPKMASSSKSRIVAARIRAGDISAFKKEDYGTTDFYSADNVSRALVDAGEDERAIEFSQNLNFEADDGNDPRTITGFVLNQIALKEFKAGNIDLAKQHIDAAKHVAGNLYYTGYCIEIDYRLIHGTITDDLKTFAQRGARYRSHMGDELVANLARVLTEHGNYKEARQVIKEIVKPDNVIHANAYLAIQQIKQHEFAKAKESIELIESAEMRFLANMHLAIQLDGQDKLKESAKLVSDLESAIESESVSKCENRFWYLVGATNDLQRAKRHLEQAKTETEKSQVILAVAKGLAKTEIY